jgi:hypothetical protein
MVYATNTDRPIIELFMQSFGGSVRTPVDQRSRKWKPISMWTACINHTGGFLRDVEPYLLLKKEQARIGLELAARQPVNKQVRKAGHRGGFGGLPDGEQGARELLVAEICRLNALACNCPHEGTPSLEYLAGFFDAEGCVGVYKHPGKKNYRMLHLNVSNRCRWILEQYKAAFGGSVCKGHGCYQWQCQCRIAQRAMQALSPLLVLKKQRALDGLSIYNHSGINNGWGLRSTENYSPVVSIAAQMAKHNKTGIEGTVV